MSKTSATTNGRTLFWCPGCEEYHWVDERWQISGTRDKPTFSPSVSVNSHGSGKRCHSFVRDGTIEFLGDCDHKLAGQTVPLPDLEAVA